MLSRFFRVLKTSSLICGCGFSGKTLEDITDETKDISGLFELSLVVTRCCSLLHSSAQCEIDTFTFLQVLKASRWSAYRTM